MLKWIRWPGLIAFVAILGGLTAFFLLLAAPLTKAAIENFGTMANGAKVELDSVGLSFSPLGITLKGLQVADAEQPMSNALSFDRAVADLELAPLLAGNGIVRELSIEGLAFGTARATSGAIEKLAEPEKKPEEPSKVQEVLDGIELPDPKEILAKETLKTETLGAGFKAGMDSNKQELDEKLAAVPSEDALKKYEDELKAITSGELKSIDDFKQRKQQLDRLKQQFKQDQAAVDAARLAVKESKSSFSQQVKDLKNAPAEDFAYLRDKFSIDAAGATNLTSLLFGDEAGEWAEKALYWYEKVKPYLGSDGEKEEKPQEQPRIRDGRVVHFPTNDPWPSILIRKIKATAVLEWGDLLVSGEDFTHQPKVLKRPAHLAVQGANLSTMNALDLDLLFAHHQSPGKDTLTLAIDRWQPEAMNLGVAGIKMTGAEAQIKAQATVQEGLLDAKGDAYFSQAKFNGKTTSTFEKELVGALSGISQFAVNSQAQGKLKSPKVKIGSDLDKQLSAAFNKRLKEKQHEFEEQLKQELNAKLEQYLGDHANLLAELEDVEGGLDAKLSKLKSLGAAELTDFEAQQKAQAKKKADAEKAEAKKKAKDSVKKLF